MICKNCGTQMADGAVFCPKCGASQAPAQPQQPQQPQYGYQQPQQPPMQPAYGYQPVPQPAFQPAKGLAIASMIMGILSLIILPIVFGILGIIFGAVAKSKGNRSPMATAGIVMSIIGVAWWVVSIVFLAELFGELYSFMY